MYPLVYGQILWCEHLHASRTHTLRTLKSARSNRQCADHRNCRVGNSWLRGARPATDTLRLLCRDYLFGALVFDVKTTCAGSGLELSWPNGPLMFTDAGSRSRRALQIYHRAQRAAFCDAHAVVGAVALARREVEIVCGRSVRGSCTRRRISCSIGVYTHRRHVEGCLRTGSPGKSARARTGCPVRHSGFLSVRLSRGTSIRHARSYDF